MQNVSSWVFPIAVTLRIPDMDDIGDITWLPEGACSYPDIIGKSGLEAVSSVFTGLQ